MKILLVGSIPVWLGGNDNGGVATHMSDLALSLKENNIDVAIATYNTYSTKSISYYDNMKIYNFPTKLELVVRSIYSIRKGLFFKAIKYTGIRGILKAFKIYSRMLYFEKIVKDFAPDIIHIHNIISYPAISIFSGKIPIVTTIHSFHSIMHEFIENKNDIIINKRITFKSLKEIKYVISVSYYLEREILKYYYRNIFVIQNPIRVYNNLKTSYRNCKNKNNILFIGNFIKRKGIFDIIEISNYLKKRISYKLIMIGDGPLIKILEKEIKKNRLEKYIHLKGRISDLDEKNKYIDNVDLLVLPSYSETWGMVFFEAFLHGRPVVSYDNSVMSEVIPNYAGLLAKDRDTIDFAEKIILALNKAWDRKKIISYAKRFSWENNVYKFIELYSEIINRY